MEWTTIDYGGMKVGAKDFLDGVLVRVMSAAEWRIVFVPGYYVQERRGDMDGPNFRKRQTTPSAFRTKIVEEE